LRSDAAGNIATKEVLFIVSDDLKLMDYGNYPNPFTSKTVFIYELTQRVDNFKIKIYTVSGRLIKVLEESTIYGSGVDINEGGYHEIVWDGLDTDGNFIANGIYFYKMIAKKRDKSVISIGKIAKAR
jgi:flagellar hook assembly protein FlgD